LIGSTKTTFGLHEIARESIGAAECLAVAKVCLLISLWKYTSAQHTSVTELVFA